MAPKWPPAKKKNWQNNLKWILYTTFNCKMLTFGPFKKTKEDQELCTIRLGQVRLHFGKRWFISSLKVEKNVQNCAYIP